MDFITITDETNNGRQYPVQLPSGMTVQQAVDSALGRTDLSRKTVYVDGRRVQSGSTLPAGTSSITISPGKVDAGF